MDTIKTRIRRLRKILDLTQQEFADGLGVKRNTIAQYETGRNFPADAVVRLICMTYGVSEAWLRNGEGEMFTERTSSQVIVDFMGGLVKEPDSFQASLIEALAKLGPDQWIVIERWVRELLEIENRKKAE